jgi:hypothetical protein
MMRILLALVLLTASVVPSAQAADETNPLFGYTHLLSTPLTLPGGRIILGTDVAYGITDFLQVGTSLLYDIYQVYNAEVKINVVNVHEFALALTGGWQSYNYDNIAPANPSIQVTSWQPGAVIGYELLPNLAHFIGANLSYANTTQNVAGTLLSGYVKGAQVESDLSWAHGPEKRPTMLVLSGGLSYDFTYKIVGFGVSYHVPGLHFGIHYYPNADQYKVQPILVGGTSFSL